VTGEEPSKTVQGLRNPSPPADMNQQGAPQKGASKTGGASGTVSGSARSSGTSGSVSGPISRSKSGSGSIPRNQ